MTQKGIIIGVFYGRFFFFPFNEDAKIALARLRCGLETDNRTPI